MPGVSTIGPASNTQQANHPSGTQGSNTAQHGNQPKKLPFTASARMHREQMALTTSTVAHTGAAWTATQITEQAIPSYGFLRGLWLRVTATGGTGTVAAVAKADAPFSALGVISITDPDGAPIYSVNSGYTAYLIHKYGGYFAGASDPKKDPYYKGVQTTGDFQFQLYLPIEIEERNGFGALPNTDSGKQYKLNINVNASGQVYSTAPTAAPNLALKVWASCWTQPPASDVLQRALTRQPPMVGSTQYWTRSVMTMAAGTNFGKYFGRVGNVVRGWIFVYRVGSARVANATTKFPNPATIYRDGYNYDVIDKNLWLQTAAERYGLTAPVETAGGLDNGVFPYMFIFDLDGRPGNELRGQWWPTLQSSRIQLTGSFGTAGTLEVITNDVAPTGTPSNRVVL